MISEILHKASSIEFGIVSGDCVIMTLCLTRYLKEKHGIELTAHIGALVDNAGNTTLHMWNSYKGKTIDLTAHNQPHETAQSMILDEAISNEGNSKRIISYRLNSKDIREFAEKQVKEAHKIDPDAITVSHIFLKYERNGKMPYRDLIDALDTKSDRLFYETFELLMEGS